MKKNNAEDIESMETFAELAEFLKTLPVCWVETVKAKSGVLVENDKSFFIVLYDEKVERSKNIIPSSGANYIGFCYAATHYIERRFGIKVFTADGGLKEFCSKCDREGYNNQRLMKLEQGKKYFSRDEFIDLWVALAPIC